jgi:transposase
VDPDQPPAPYRVALRYGGDVTDAEWAILEPFLPPPCRYGRKRRWPMRRIVEAIFFIIRAGCAWDRLADSFPPSLTVHRWFVRFRDDSTWERINHHLVMQDHERVARQASPSAAVVDSQSAKTREADGPSGHNAGKKVKGRKRHALVDTDGRLIKISVHPADFQDRDTGAALKASRASFPFVERVFADSAYAGERVAKRDLRHGRRALLRLDRTKPPLLPRRRTPGRLGRGIHLCRLLRQHHPTNGALPMRFEMSSYNKAEYVGFAVESAIFQTYGNIEVIVIDDGSSDNSVKVLEQYHDRITLITNPNGGDPDKILCPHSACRSAC